MAFQSVPNTAEAVVQYTWGGQAVANVLNFVRPGGYDIASLTTLAAVVDLWVDGSLLPMMSNEITYVQTLVRGLENANDLEVTDNTSTGTGTAAQPSVPNNVAFCVTHRTGFTGRSARGRTYLPGMLDSNTIGSTAWAASLGTQVDTAFASLNSLAAAAGWQFAVVSRFTAGALRPVGVTFIITASEVRNLLIDSQRGRLPAGH